MHIVFEQMGKMQGYERERESDVRVMEQTKRRFSRTWITDDEDCLDDAMDGWLYGSIFLLACFKFQKGCVCHDQGGRGRRICGQLARSGSSVIMRIQWSGCVSVKKRYDSQVSTTMGGIIGGSCPNFLDSGGLIGTLPLPEAAG